MSTNVFRERSLKTDLELVNLAIFIVLELVHVLFELLAFLFGGFLLVFRGLDSCFEVSDGLFESINFSSDLKKNQHKVRTAKKYHLPSPRYSLRLVPPASSFHAL